MKRRLLVLNGQRIVQSEEDGPPWRNDKVEKSGGLKPGVYNLYTAEEPIVDVVYEGIVLWADAEGVYQEIAPKKFIRHSALNFDKLPIIGRSICVKYEKGCSVPIVYK